MAKAFTKGEAVFKISNWNSMGQYSIIEAVVHSCGERQMVLNRADTGECLGRHFNPKFEQRDRGEVRNDLTREQAEARALELAEAYLAKEIEAKKNLIANNSSYEGYVKAAQKSLNELEAASTSFFWG